MTTEGTSTSTHQKILSTPILLMADTGIGKSSLLATLAEYVFEHFGMVTQYYSSDGGAFPVQVQALVNLGIIRMWRMKTRSGERLSHETCQRAAQGWWPRRVDPATGQTDPNVELVAPLTDSYEMYCPKGHLIKTVPFRSLLNVAATCPVQGCGTVTLATPGVAIKIITVRTKGFEKVGAAVFDGISSMMSWGMHDLADRSGAGTLQGEKSALGGIIDSGDIKLAGTNRAQVGFMQSRAERLIAASEGIPFLVVPPVWTALMQEGTDESGMRIKGPQIIGQARTAEAPAWFGDAFELVVREEGGKKYRRINMKTYVDATGMRHLCGVRSFPGLMPDFLEDEDTGRPEDAFKNFNFATIFKLRQEALAKTEAAYGQRYQNAPGLEEIEYGSAPEVKTGPTGPATKPVAAPARPAAPRPVQPAQVAQPTQAASAPVQAPKPAPVAAPTPAAPAPAAPPAQAPRPQAQVARPNAVPAPQARPAAPVTPAPRPAPAPAQAAPASPTPAPAPSVAATGVPVGTPPAPKPPARGPSPPPPGRRPTPQ